MSHAIFNAHFVNKAGLEISGNFHYVRDFTWSSLYHTEPLFTDKLHKSRLIMNVVLLSLSVELESKKFYSSIHFLITLFVIVILSTKSID